MALKDYVNISVQASEWLGEFLGKYRPYERQYALATGIGGTKVFLSPDPGGGGGTVCQADCTGSCVGSCKNTCTGSCKTGCSGTCKTGCSGTCKSSCSGTCKNGCKDGCTGSCNGTCTNDCTGTCQAGYCEGYCQICQTFCEHNQVFSKNNGANKGTGMGSSFAWNRTYTAGDKIIIEATKWDELAGYINNAQVYCGSGDSTNVINNVSQGDVISAAIWNNLNNGLKKINSAVSFVNQNGNIDKIKATEVNALATKYNEAQIKSSLPTNANGASKNLCCQDGMTPEESWGSKRACPQTVNKECASHLVVDC